MISLKTALDTRRAKQDSTYPIVFRVSFEGKSRDITTGFSCRKDQWNSRISQISAKSKEQEVINQTIQETRADYISRIVEYQKQFKRVSEFSHLKRFLLQENVSEVTFISDFWEGEIERLESTGNEGNAYIYRDCLNRVGRYMDLRVSFEEVDYKSLLKLETAMRVSELSTNTIGITLRTFRAVFNSAIRSELTPSSHYPFKNLVIKKGVIKPRPIIQEETRNYFQYEPVGQERDHWNYGKLILMLRGINFKDLALLTRNNLRDGRLIYTRSKTEKVYSVEILPQVQELIDYYFCPWRSTLFPILEDIHLSSSKSIAKRVREQNKTTNKWLKRIGVKIGSKERLTTYVFRYTHANLCKQLGYSKDMISESLGHGYGLAVSTNYLESYDIELIDEMNARVIESILVH